MNQKVSGVIITFNEEACIQHCIESLKPVCDEIIVLDSFSIDKTETICRSLQVRFYQKKFDGYGSQKRAAVELASYPFILSLDADEFLSPELIEEINKEKTLGLKEIYSMPRLNNYCGQWVRYSGWYPDRKIRLWHREKAEWENKNVHESVVPIEPNAKIEKLKSNILHYTYIDNKDHLTRIEHYTDIQSQQMYEQGKRTGFLRKYVSGAFRFIYIYVLRLGFLDGHVGLNIASLSAWNQYLKYYKLEQLIRQKNSPRTK